MRKLSITIIIFVMFMLLSVFVTAHAAEPKEIPNAKEIKLLVKNGIKHIYDLGIVGKHSFLGVYVYPKAWMSLNIDEKSQVAVVFSTNRQYNYDGKNRITVYNYMNGKQLGFYEFKQK